MCSHFPPNAKDMNEEGTVACHGLKWLKQTHDATWLIVFPDFIILTDSSVANTPRNDFLPVEDERHF